jgi:hypothetical protein
MASECGPYRAAMMKFDPVIKIEKLEFTWRGKKTTAYLEQVVPGVVIAPFRPLNDDSIDEFIGGAGFDEDIEDSAVYDDDRDVDTWGICYRNDLDLRTLRVVRGTARNLIVITSSISNNLACVSKKYNIYVKTKTLTYKTWLRDMDHYLFVIGPQSNKIQIEGYRMLSFNQKHNISKSKYRESPTVMCQGIKYSIEEAFEDWGVRDSLSGLNDYFKKIAPDTTVAEAEQVSEKIQKLKVPEAVSVKAEMIQKKACELGLKLKRKQEPSETLGSDAQSLEEMLAELKADISKLISGSGTFDKSSRTLRVIPRTMRFQEPVEVLTDLEVCAQIDTILSEYREALMRGEIFSTQRTLDVKIASAKNFIKTMSKRQQLVYNRILLVIKSLFSLVTIVNNRKMETHDFLNSVEDIFYTGAEHDEEEISLSSLSPEYQMDIQYNIDVDRVFSS